MSTRVTQNMMTSQFLSNLYKNENTMSNLQNELASGRQINKPSDDPVGITYALRYRSELSQNDQYQSNANNAQSWLQNSDSTLGQVDSVWQRVRELAVQASNGTNPQDALDSINAEVKQLSDQLVSIGNSTFNGKYIFNGQMTDQPPYDKNNPVSDTNNGEVKTQIGVGVNISLNVTGNQVFGTAGAADNAFTVLKNLQSALSSGNTTQISSLLGSIDSRMNSILLQRANVGATLNRVQLAQSRLTDINTNLQTLQSKTEDVDIAKAVTNLQTSQNVYQASLSIGAKIMQTSLVDFLK